MANLRSRQHGRPASTVRFFAGSILAGLFLALALTGCKSGAHTSDPHLRQLDRMLDAQLPQGTPKTRVLFYLNSQNFPMEASNDGKSVMAIVHRVDTDTLQPITARVIFHFDASDKLKTYEMDTSAGSPQQP